MNVSNTRKIKPYTIYINKLYSIYNNDSAVAVLLKLFFWSAMDTSMYWEHRGGALRQPREASFPGETS